MRYYFKVPFNLYFCFKIKKNLNISYWLFIFAEIDLKNPENIQFLKKQNSHFIIHSFVLPHKIPTSCEFVVEPVRN